MPEDQRVTEFIALITRHEPRLRGYILALVPSWSDAEDILQQTNAMLWEKFDEFDRSGNFFAWACRVAYYEVLHWRRRQSRERLRFGDAFIEAVAAEAEAMQQEISRRMEALVDCFQKLSAKDRRLIEARYFENATTQDAARRTGRSVEAVYKALARIRMSLMQCIERQTSAEGTT